MPFDWGEFLTIAGELAPRVDNEAAARTAISRAYYAALGRAATWLRSEGVPISSLRIHGEVWRAFQNSRDPRRAAIGRDLDWLRQQRNRADYDGSTQDGLPFLASEAVVRAAAILRALDDLRSAPA
jgi:hypothetical protein